MTLNSRKSTVCFHILPGAEVLNWRREILLVGYRILRILTCNEGSQKRIHLKVSFGMHMDVDVFMPKTERATWILSDSWIMNISTVSKLQICFIPCEMPFKTNPYNLLRQVSHILDSWTGRQSTNTQLKPVNFRHSSKRRIPTQKFYPVHMRGPEEISPTLSEPRLGDLIQMGVFLAQTLNYKKKNQQKRTEFLLSVLLF